MYNQQILPHDEEFSVLYKNLCIETEEDNIEMLILSDSERLLSSRVGRYRGEPLDCYLALKTLRKYYSVEDYR